jgi:polar amino acid transport system substrate-binding protein
MKRLIAVGLILTMAVSFAGCSKKEAKVISSVKDLEGAKIGVQTGTTGDIYASDQYGDSAIDRYDKGFEAVQALSQGKVDAVIIDDQPAQVFVEQNEGLKILDEEYALEDYAICIAKENTELKDQINSAIAELKENGTFQAIVDFYIGNVEGSARYVAKDVERNGQLVMATNAEFPPYEFREGDGFAGVDVDMAQAIADILGKELVISDMKFDSIIAAVQTGKADIGCAGMTITEDRLQSIDFTDSYYTGRQVVIVKE